MDSLFRRLFSAESRAFRLDSRLSSDDTRLLAAQQGLRAAQTRSVFGTVFGSDHGGGGSDFTPGTYLFRVVDCGGDGISGASILARVGSASNPFVTIGATDSDGYFSYYAATADTALYAVKAVATYGESTAFAPIVGYAYDLPIVPTAPYFCLCGRLMQPDTITDYYGTASWTASGSKWVATTTMDVGFGYQTAGGACALRAQTTTVNFTWELSVDSSSTVHLSLIHDGLTNLTLPWPIPLVDSWNGCTGPASSYDKTYPSYTTNGTLSCAATPEFLVKGGAIVHTNPGGGTASVYLPQQYDLSGTKLWNVVNDTFGSGQHSEWTVNPTALTIAKITFKDYP